MATVERLGPEDRLAEAGLRRMLKQRIAAEFREMPGLCLTVSQASRLFGLVDEVCEHMLTELVDERVIQRAAGNYRSMPVESASNRGFVIRNQ